MNKVTTFLFVSPFPTPVNDINPFSNSDGNRLIVRPSHPPAGIDQPTDPGDKRPLQAESAGRKKH
jgi:hypothetical protein